MDWIALFLTLYFVAPIMLSKLAVKARWSDVALGYVVLVAMILAVGLFVSAGASSPRLAFGFALLIGAPAAVLAVPLAAFGFKAARRAS